MLIRRRLRSTIHVLTAFCVVGFLFTIVYFWNSFSHRELDDFFQDGKKLVPRLLQKKDKNVNELVEEGRISHTDQTDPLAEAFKRADSNGDKVLTGVEIEKWIVDKTQEHLNEGEGEISKMFLDVDKDQSGVVTWDEFAHWYKTNPEKREKTKDIADLKEEWDVSDSDHNTLLNEHEFLCFRHPELCKETLRQLTQDVLKNLDKDSDGSLTEQEYIAPPPGQVEEGFQDYEIRFKEQRKREFEAIDTDKDGVATEDELKVFLNPRNHIHAKTEAEELIDAADENEDGRLSYDEVYKHKDLFEQSKLMDVGETFHNDF